MTEVAPGMPKDTPEACQALSLSSLFQVNLLCAEVTPALYT